MELIGTIKGLSQDILTGKTLIIFEVEDGMRAAKEAQPLSGLRLRIAAKRYREKRSLDANAYYWQLLTKAADILELSNPEAHNRMLRRYGQPEIINGKMVFLVLPDTDDAEKIAFAAETYHIKPTSEVKMGADGMMYRTYFMLRGSSTYDTKEMSTLINGLVSECKEMGIETMTPAELERMMEAYEKKYQEKHCAS